MSARSASLARIVTLVSLFAGLAACTESASISVNFTSQNKPTRNLSIDNFQGSVHLSKGQAGTAVTGRARITAAGFDSKGEAKDAALDVELRENVTAQAEAVVQDLELVVTAPNVRGGKTFDIDLDLTVPEGVAVNVITDNGDIVVESLPILRLDTTNGRIDLEFTTGQGQVVTNDARIDVSSHQGDIELRTSNAPIEMAAIAGNVNARTTNGSIVARVTPPAGGQILLATTNAPVDLTFDRTFGSRILGVTSGAGRVFFENLIFSSGGSMSFPGQAEGQIGNGAGLVDVRTTESDVVIRGR